MEKIVLYLIVFIVLFPVIILTSVFITGRVDRAYPVLADDLEIEINGKRANVHAFAEKYSPIMYKQSEVQTPPILWVWYNAVDMRDKVDFIYYVVWENEINPNPLIHRYYSIFRAFYYGYPLYDIEYVQISVSKLNGNVEAFMFETGPSDNYYSIVNEHLVLKATNIGEGNYAIRLIDRDTKGELDSFIGNPGFADLHLKLGVQTWNHLSTLILPSKDSIYTDEVSYSRLKYLIDDEYANNKFVRKSQGDHVTEENKISVLVSAIAIFIFVTFPGILLSRIKKQ
jgi:hypothetical protein